MSDSLRPHEPQHARPPCPSPTPGVHPNPCPLSQWCHPTISSSVVPFSCPLSFPASASFQMSDLTSLHFLLRGQNFPLLPNQQQQKRLPFNTTPKWLMTFPGGSVVKEPTCQARNMGSISGSGRTLGGGHSNSLQYSCLGIPMNKEAWWTTDHGVTDSQTGLRRYTTTTKITDGSHEASFR